MAKSLYASYNQHVYDKASKKQDKFIKKFDKMDAKQQKTLKSICKESDRANKAINRGAQVDPKERSSRASRIMACLDTTGRTSDGFEY